MAPWKRVAIVVLSTVAAFVALGAGYFVFAVVPDVRRKTARTRSEDNLRSLALLYVRSGRALPPVTGKRLVLALALQTIDVRRSQDLEILFSPGDRERSVEEAGGVTAFAALTPQRIADPSFDLDRFTSYAGPAAPVGSATPTEGRGNPLFADLSDGDVAIIAFTGGGVSTFAKTDLDLGPKDPLVVGPTSKSPLLRSLSDR
jgi:hypothetical protein